jgi:cardiolipin synthase
MQFIWYHALFTLQLVLSIVASSHVVLNKRDVRACIGWVGLIWLTPFFGTFLYWAFGINRIARRAKAMRDNDGASNSLTPQPSMEAALTTLLPSNSQLAYLARLVANVTHLPLTTGNDIRPLVNGDEAYPRMLKAIADARQSITLSSYIFDRDRIGNAFARQLSEAVQRGVEVRVLVDAVGARYSRPTIARLLRELNVRVELFHPTFIRSWFRYSNLRNHRKLLVVDGRIGFTGGMNIRESCLLQDEQPRHPIQDLHFEVTGPVVEQLQTVFLQDWKFASGENLSGEIWISEPANNGSILARTISDGPDEQLDHLRMTLLGAIDCACHSIKIMTPYFLPDATIISALNTAALQGIQVEILIPERSNVPIVQWATTATLWQILERGCRVTLSPVPFDHSKLIVVDQYWFCLGSANWDARSLRLNFELNLECYDETLGIQLAAMFDQKARLGKPVTLADVDTRHLLVKLRDGFARLLSPYL